MSHITKVEVEIKDLEALAAACRRLGCELRLGQRTFVWYSGTDGTCEHAVSVPGASYEVGVAARQDGRPGYALLWDSYSYGGLEAKLGQGACRLVQAYGVEAATRAARRQGYSVTETTREDGAVVLKVRAS
jgi:hypothetical protein